jgi:uncharacterized damage-inducible protein DinB
MDVTSVSAFVDYYEKVRGRTLHVIDAIPPGQIDWTYRPGKWTAGDLVRHIAAIERWMYGETLQNRPTRYAGCGRDLADGYDAIRTYFDEMHAQTMDILGRFTDADLKARCTTPAGSPIGRGKWMRAMLEHEIHHRGQLYTYLGLLDIPAPPLYGLTSEEVAARRATA